MMEIITLNNNLLIDGLNKTIEKICFIKSEDIAIFGYIYDNSLFSSLTNSNSLNSSSIDNEETEIVYSELIYLRNILIKQLYYRYNITRKNNILILCKGFILPEIISCLACIKLNCSFIPIDINWIHTGNRLNDIINDCLPIAAIVVAENDNDEIVRTLAKAGVHRCVLLQPDGNIVYDESWNSLLTSSSFSFSFDESIFNFETSLSDPLYIIYTSGSTGKPKGVPGTHEGLINRILWQSKKYPWKNSLFKSKSYYNNLNEENENEENENEENESEENENEEEDENEDEDVVCRRTPLVFVDSMVEIFGALTSGTKIWSPSRYDPGTFNTTKYLPSNKSLLSIAKFGPSVGVSHITLLPSQLTILLNYIIDLNNKQDNNHGDNENDNDNDIDENKYIKNWTSLRIVFVSGETCSIQTIELFQKCALNGYIPNATLINLYGSTEISGDVTATTLCWKNIHNNENMFQICDTLYKNFNNNSNNSLKYNGFVPIGSEIIEGNWCYIVDTTTEISEESNEIFTLINEVGKEGELLVGGKHVALGYLNNKNDNENNIHNKFIKNPFHKCLNTNSNCIYCLYPTLFRTGDIVKLHSIDSDTILNYPLIGSSYHIELIGRRDLIIKLSGGIRIQLEEVEKSISNFISSKYSLLTNKFVIESNHIITISLLIKPKNENIIVLYLSKDILNYCNIPIDLYEILLLSSSSSSNNNNNNNTENYNILSSAYIKFTAYIRNILSSQLSTTTSNTNINHNKLNDFPIIFLPTLVIPIISIPLTPSTGKLDRVKLQNNANDIYYNYFVSKFEQTNIIEQNEENQISIIYYLIKLYRGILPLDPTSFLESQINNLNQENSNITSFAALGGDSMSSIEVRWNISKTYHIELSNDELMNFSLSKLSSLILFKLKNPTQSNFYDINNNHNNNDSVGGSNQINNNNKRKRENDNLKDLQENDNLKPSLTKIIYSIELIPLFWRSRGIQGSLNSIISNFSISPNIISIILSYEWKCQLSRCIDTTPLVITSSSILSSHHNYCYVGSHSGEVTAISLSENESSRIIWNILLGKNIHIEGGIICDPKFKLILTNNFELNNIENKISYPIFLSSYKAIDRDGPVLYINDTINNEEENKEIKSIGQLWCLDSSNGNIIWNTNNLIKDEVKGSPILLHLSSTFSIIVCGSHGGIVYIFNAYNGSLLNTFDGSTYGSIFSSIVSNCEMIINDQLLFHLYVFTTKGYVYCLNLQFISYITNTIELSQIWIISTLSNSPIFGTPSLISFSKLSNNKTFNLVFGTVSGHIYCISCKNGLNLWTYEALPHLLDRSPFFSSPCIIQRNCNNSINNPEYIVIGSHDGWIRFININNGTLQFEVEIGSVIYGSPTYFSIENIMDIIVVCTTGGDVCLLQGNWKNEQINEENIINDWKIVSRYKLPGEIYSSPTIVQYCMNDNKFKIGICIGCRDDCVHYFSIII